MQYSGPPFFYFLTALLNKANVIEYFATQNGTADFDFNNLRTVGFFKLAGDFHNAAHRPDGAYGDYSVLVTGDISRMAQIAIYGNAVTYGVTMAWRSCGWTGEFPDKWEYTATATPPQEHALPLAAGCTAHYASTYHKEQNGKVYGELAVKHATAGSVDGMTLCTLPAGYRPLKPCVRSATIAGTGNYDHAGSIEIDIYGVVRLFGISNAGIATADFVVFADFWFLTS